MNSLAAGYKLPTVSALQSGLAITSGDLVAGAQGVLQRVRAGIERAEWGQSETVFDGLENRERVVLRVNPRSCAWLESKLQFS